MGFGSTVIAKLKKAGLTRNLYYEIKEQVVEERQDGFGRSYKKKEIHKVYGLNSDKAVRKSLIDLLIDRVESHKDKFVSPIIYEELKGMEIKRNGKVEHSSSTHDDQVFSMLMALYVWYEGKNLLERFGIQKTSIKTDEDVDDDLDYLTDDTVDIVESFTTNDELEEEVNQDLEAAIKAGGTPIQEFLEKQRSEEQAQFGQLLRTPAGERAYRQKYNIPDHVPIQQYSSMAGGMDQIPYSVFLGFYDQDGEGFNTNYDITKEQMTAPADQTSTLETNGYHYNDYFNF